MAPCVYKRSRGISINKFFCASLSFSFISLLWYQSYPRLKGLILDQENIAKWSTSATTSIEANPLNQVINPLEDTASSFYLHHSKNHRTVTVTLELTSNNYPSWRRSFQLAISIGNKQGFLDGSILKPTQEDPLYLLWIRYNNLIVAWLLKSISSSIASTVFYLEDANRFGISFIKDSLNLMN